MKLAKTLIIEGRILPNYTGAFTLAEVLITLSILGVVAAITVPQMVKHQSEKAAIVKLHKAISTYEKAAGVYLAENRFNGDRDLSLMVGNENCERLKGFFKMSNNNWTTDLSGNNICAFTTKDGALWMINTDGNAVVLDTPKKPKYGVVMWTQADKINDENINSDGIPDSSSIPDAPKNSEIGNFGNFANNVEPPIHGYYTAAQMINLKGPTATVTSADSSRDAVSNLKPSANETSNYAVVGPPAASEHCQNVYNVGCSCYLLNNYYENGLPAFSCEYYPSATASLTDPTATTSLPSCTASSTCYPSCTAPSCSSSSSTPSCTAPSCYPSSSSSTPSCTAPSCYNYPINSEHSSPQCTSTNTPGCHCYPSNGEFICSYMP